MSSKSGRENGELKPKDLKSLSDNLFDVYNQYNDGRITEQEAKTMTDIAQTIVKVRGQELNEKRFDFMVKNKIENQQLKTANNEQHITIKQQDGK